MFLKTSRLIKRRTIAREMCDSGRVLVNGLTAKPAREVKPGDVITLKFSSRTIDLEALSPLAEQSEKTPPDRLYRLLSEKRSPKDEDLWKEYPQS
jgi:ribosomal 50S subunit-recycling heat shock protein